MVERIHRPDPCGLALGMHGSPVFMNTALRRSIYRTHTIVFLHFSWRDEVLRHLTWNPSADNCLCLKLV